MLLEKVQPFGSKTDLFARVFVGGDLKSFVLSAAAAASTGGSAPHALVAKPNGTATVANAPLMWQSMRSM